MWRWQPLFSTQAPNSGYALFVLETQRQGKQILAIPQLLSLDEIDGVRGFVAGAFGWIKFELYIIMAEKRHAERSSPLVSAVIMLKKNQRQTCPLCPKNIIAVPG
jgi:hypothetical protein